MEELEKAQMEQIQQCISNANESQKVLVQFWSHPNRSVLSIAKKIQQIMTEVTYIWKDGKNTHQRYSYVSEAQACAVVRESWIKNGVVAIPYVDQLDFERVAPTKSGTAQYMATVGVVYQLIDTDSGETILARFVGQGVDSGDKGIYKALTGANKYFLFKTFQLETTDTPQAPKGNMDAERANEAEKDSAASKYEDKAKKSNPPVQNQGKYQNKSSKKPYVFYMVTENTGNCAWCIDNYSPGNKIVKALNNEVGHTDCWKKTFHNVTGIKKT